MAEKKSDIHIKESHKGLFTKHCGGKVTNECIEEGLASSSAKVRARANFAKNIMKFNH